MAQKLTNIQLRIAHALAQRARHQWAQIPLALLPLEPEAIAAMASLITEEDASPGILCPVLQEDGTVYHVSAGRRIEWAIAPNGHTTISIHRPGGALVLERAIQADGSPYWGWYASPYGAPLGGMVDPALSRLEAVLKALGDDGNDVEYRLRHTRDAGVDVSTPRTYYVNEWTTVEVQEYSTVDDANDALMAYQQYDSVRRRVLPGRFDREILVIRSDRLRAPLIAAPTEIIMHLLAHGVLV